MAGATLTNNVNAGERARNFGLVSSLALLVMALGYLRDAIFAARFGVSATMDAYVAAFFIPNALYLVLIAGALSPVFITVFHRFMNENPEEGYRVFSLVVSLSALALLGLVTLGSLSARWWLPLLFSGFSHEQLELSLRLCYIIFPAIVFLGLAGIVAALLNSLDHFVFPALSPLAYTVLVIPAVLLARGGQAIYWVGIATAAGLIAQFLIQLPMAARIGVRFYWFFDYRHPSLRLLLRLGFPLFLYLLVAHASLVVERKVASQLWPGAVSSINYATRLFTLPANLVAAPLALVLYPAFSREAAQANWGDLQSELLKSIRLTVFLFLPITAWMFFQAMPLTRLIFERGQFVFRDSEVTAGILRFYSLGLFFNALTVMLLRGFYSIHDTITPLVVELINFVFYIAVAPCLAGRYSLQGLAITRAISFFLVATLLLFTLNRKLRLFPSLARQVPFVLKTAGASVLMGTTSWIGFLLAREPFEHHGILVRASVMTFLVIFCGILYLALCRWWRVSEVNSVIRLCSVCFGESSKQLVTMRLLGGQR